MNKLKDFYNRYPVAKTLRFRLEPIGMTEQYIMRAQVLENDERLAIEYKQVKQFIDRYHRHFIDQVFSNPLLKVASTGQQDSLEDFVDCYNNDNSEKRKENLDKIQERLRKQIHKGFTSHPTFAHINKKELIKEYLPQFLTDEKEKELVSHFNEFTTYFSDFHKNRMNMYDEAAKSTSITFRAINQNLVKFVDNSNILVKVAPALGENTISMLNKDFEPYLNVFSVLDMFKVENYNDVMSQKQIDLYNAIIGGRVDEGKAIEIKGLNQYINEYNQIHDKPQRIPKLKPLFKQILSEGEGISFRLAPFENCTQLQQTLKESILELDKDVFPKLQEMLANLDSYNLSGIYVDAGQGLTDISQRHYGAWDRINNALVAEFDAQVPRKKSQSQQKRDDQVKKYLKGIDSLSLARIDSLLKDMTGISIADYFKSLGAVDNENMQRENLFALIRNNYANIKHVLECSTPSDELLRKNIEQIKDLLDSVKALQRFVMPLCGSGTEQDKDDMFYSDFSVLYEKLDETITPLYNKVRNYLTKKPYSLEKFRLNFESPTLLNSWPNPQAYSCALFVKDEKHYYLAILENNHRNCFNEVVAPREESDTIGLVKHLQGGNMGNNVQNLMRVDGVVKKINGRREQSGPYAGQNLRLEEAKKMHLPNEINEIRIKRAFSISSPNYSRTSLNKFIDFYKPLVREYYSDYDFEFKETSQYNDFADFTNHINQQAYQLTLQPYSKAHLKELVNDGKVFLFRLMCKDFSEHSKGRLNLHTIYWNMLFDKENSKKIVYKLSGGAKMFFRPQSIKSPVVHKANSVLENKSEYNQQHKPMSKFDYDIIKDRRFTRNHYEFHVPITMNFSAKPSGSFNQDVLSFIKNNGIKHIIGIDRGERHLLYLTMIDMHGNIVKQFSLNDVASNPNNPDYKQDYNTLLASKEGDRLNARRNWTTIENIKELKQGYLSQIVHIISNMMIENDAIVVLENLNTGFMRGRQKVEKSVYQKFEKMLIDKLNYVVDKTARNNEPCGALKALQLTYDYETFNRTQKGNVRQCGFLFYIPAWNTSKIDPTTGFVNLFDTRLASIAEIKGFFSKFDRIKYNAEKDVFEFNFDYVKFTNRAEGSRTKWTINTYGERIFTHRSKDQYNNFVSETVKPTQLFKDVFNAAGLDINSNLKEAIASINNLDPLKQLLHAFKLTLQMRNSETGTQVDYLISPAVDDNGCNFDSRLASEKLPANADANGAYNIARKGLMIVEQIKDADKVEGMKYSVTNKDWLNFAQK